jgi:hypothetical protein
MGLCMEWIVTKWNGYIWRVQRKKRLEIGKYFSVIQKEITITIRIIKVDPIFDERLNVEKDLICVSTTECFAVNLIVSSKSPDMTRSDIFSALEHSRHYANIKTYFDDGPEKHKYIFTINVNT